MAQTNDSQEQVTINVETLQPVTRTLMTIGALPTSYLISMTYEEQLLWLQNYLIKTVIPAINNNAEATQEVQDIVMALQDYINDYFNNLDVQEEINNKLEQMAQDGSLTTLIEDYVNPYIEAQNQEISAFKTSVNNQIAAQNAQIQAVTSGSPLVASSVDQMTDTTRVYVNTTDGKWYYYDGTEWTIGGVYQATGIADGSVDVYKTDFYEMKSLIPRTDWVSGKLLASTTGNIYSGTGAYNPNYIEVTSRNGIFIFNENLSIIALTIVCYDTNKDFISSVIPATANQYVVTLPENTKYIRFSISGTNFTTLPDNTAMFVTLDEFLKLRSFNKNNQIKEEYQTNLSSDEIIIPNNRNFFILPIPSANALQYPTYIDNINLYEIKFTNTTSTTNSNMGVRFYAENLQVGDKLFVNINGTSEGVTNVNLYAEDNYNVSSLYRFINEYDKVYSLTLTSEMITKINNLLDNNKYPRIHILHDNLTVNSTVTRQMKVWINNSFGSASNGFENLGTRLSKLEKKYSYKALYLGDSITALTGTSGWWTYFNKIIGVTQYQNVAVAGAHLKDYSDSVYDGNPVLNGPDHNHNNVLGNQVQKIINHQATYLTPDFIIIAIGTNDGITATVNDAYDEYYNQNGSIKALTDVDRQTSAGAFRYCNEKLHELYPDAMIIWCTPIQACNTIRNVKNVIEWGDSLKLLCSFGSNFCIDTEKCGICGINEINGLNGEDLADGLHPNPNGAKKMGTFNACEFKKFLDRINFA